MSQRDEAKIHYTYRELHEFIRLQPLRKVRDPLRAYAAYRGLQSLRSDWISITTERGLMTPFYSDQALVSYVLRQCAVHHPHNFKQLLNLIPTP